MHVIAAKAVAFGEALQPQFKLYARRVIENARALADALQSHGMNIVSGGTDSHLMVVDLTPKDVTGKAAEDSLERAGITCSRSTIPFDPRPPMLSSGVRLGTPAGTTRGFGTAEFRRVAQMIAEVVDGLAANGVEGNSAVETKVRADVLELTRRFPIYG
jgi:glycine hydroxymethyltransferase